MVYMADSISLAVLENLVHMSREDYPKGYIVLSATIPDYLAVVDLVASPGSTSTVGDFWFDAGKSAAARVSSAVVPGEFNYLLNPTHSDFSRLLIDVGTFVFDPRLFG